MRRRIVDGCRSKFMATSRTVVRARSKIVQTLVLTPGVMIDLDGGNWPQREGVGIAPLILNARRTTCSQALHCEQVFVRTA